MAGPTSADIDQFSINKCVSWYLIHSYLYYLCDTPVISDAAFDRICERLSQEFDSIDHPHDYLLDRDAMTAGTGHHIPYDQYPLIVRNLALDIKDGKFNAWGNPTPKSEIYNISLS